MSENIERVKNNNTNTNTNTTTTTTTMSTTQSNVGEKLQRLKKYDYVTITWVDACQSANVPLNGKFPNKSIETQVTSEGRYLGLQNGESYNDVFILILKDTIDHERATVQSVPLAITKSIESIEKTQLMHLNHGANGNTRIEFRYDDGIVKFVDIPTRREC